MAKQVMLTTKDNPFNPITDFENWNQFDEAKGYNTISLICRLCKTSMEEGEEAQHEAWVQAIDDVLKYVDYGIYVKVEE